MVGDPEFQSVRASNLLPRPYDVLFRPDVHAVPRLVFRIPTIEIVVVVAERDEVLGPGFGVEANEFLGIPAFRPPGMTDVFITKLRGVPISLEVVVLLRIALHIHAASTPIALFRNALRTPMNPHSELCVLKPFRVAVSLQRFPIGPEGTSNRAACKTAVRVGATLSQCSVGGEGKQPSPPATNFLLPKRAGP